MLLEMLGFIDDIIKVENADKEIAKLSEINTSTQVVVDERYESPSALTTDSTKTTIQLISYKANHLIYKSNTQIDQFAVFSEIYYDKGWNAYIDGELASYVRANYVLRAMAIPAGSHTIGLSLSQPHTTQVKEYRWRLPSLCCYFCFLLFIKS